MIARRRDCRSLRRLVAASSGVTVSLLLAATVCAEVPRPVPSRAEALAAHRLFATPAQRDGSRGEKPSEHVSRGDRATGRPNDGRRRAPPRKPAARGSRTAQVSLTDRGTARKTPAPVRRRAEARSVADHRPRFDVLLSSERGTRVLFDGLPWRSPDHGILRIERVGDERIEVHLEDGRRLRLSPGDRLAAAR